MADYPVKVYCPLRNIEDLVYFHPIQYEGKWYVDKESFNGCENSFHGCKECDECKEVAYKKIFESE